MEKNNTRAIFRFMYSLQLPRTYNNIFVYVKRNGDPDGAAQSIKKMLEIGNSNGCLASQFIRSNENAIITESPENHTDTEFQYYVTSKIVSAERLILIPKHRPWYQFKLPFVVRRAKERKKWNVYFQSAEWHVFYHDTPQAFIEKYVSNSQ